MPRAPSSYVSGCVADDKYSFSPLLSVLLQKYQQGSITSRLLVGGYCVEEISLVFGSTSRIWPFSTLRPSLQSKVRHGRRSKRRGGPRATVLEAKGLDPSTARHGVGVCGTG